MDQTSTYPTDIATLHLMLREQQQLIESLKANLHRLLKWRFGPKSESVDVNQFGLFADGSLVIEVPVRPEPEAEASQSASTDAPAERRRAMRVLKNMPRVIEQIEVPEEQKTCPCCGERMSRFGPESSEQLHYVPARLEVHETRRQKYSCGRCHGAVVRAQLPVLPPIPKSMASASLLAYLIVSKFADGLPLYRIAGRLARLGIELSHTLMSEWLVQCAELLEDLHQRMTARVLDSGHVYTDDTTLPLQNHDPVRHKTYEAKLWVYAKDNRHGPPLIVYEFSKSRTRDAPLTFLKDYRGYLQADAYPGYDPLFRDGKIMEVACNVHARRRFVEAAGLLKNPGRPHDAAAIYYSLVESCKANKVNPLRYLTYVLSNARNRAVVLPTPDEFADPSATPAGGCAL